MAAVQQGLPTLRRERLIDRAVDAIKQHIIVNRLQPGDRLPSEPDLAGALGISRNVVRQAVSSLEAVGIVQSEQGRGTFVADVGATSNVLQHLDFWLDLANLDQREYTETRSVFDAGVLQLAMRSATDDDLDRLDAIVDRMAAQAEQDDRAAFGREHDAFHEALLDATRNRFLAGLTMILYRFLWHAAAAAPNVRLVPRGDQVRAHRELVAGLRSRDESSIPRLVALHLGQRS